MIDLERINDSELAFSAEYAAAGKNCLRRIRVLPMCQTARMFLDKHRSYAYMVLVVGSFQESILFLIQSSQVC